MMTILRALVILILLQMGVILLLLPWSNVYWDHNYFLSRYPELIRFLLHPSMRGAISGLGVLDIMVAISLLRRRPQPVPH